MYEQPRPLDIPEEPQDVIEGTEPAAQETAYDGPPVKVTNIALPPEHREKIIAEAERLLAITQYNQPSREHGYRSTRASLRRRSLGRRAVGRRR